MLALYVFLAYFSLSDNFLFQRLRHFNELDLSTTLNWTVVAFKYKPLGKEVLYFAVASVCIFELYKECSARLSSTLHFLTNSYIIYIIVFILDKIFDILPTISVNQYTCNRGGEKNNR